MHRSTRDRRGLDLDFGGPLPDVHPRIIVAAAGDTLDVDAAQVFQQIKANAVKCGVDTAERRVAILNGKAGEVDIDRWTSSHEIKVNGQDVFDAVSLCQLLIDSE
jgi:hypothetical protein